MQAQTTAPVASSAEGAILSFDVAGLRKLIRDEVRTALEAFTPQTATNATDAPKYYTREEVGQMLHVSLTYAYKVEAGWDAYPSEDRRAHALSLRGCKEGATDDESEAIGYYC